MKIRTVVAGEIRTNCYVVWCDETNDAVVIDPAGNWPLIDDVIRKDRLHIVAIVNTHGHGDHIGANGPAKQQTGSPLAIGAKDAHMLTSAESNLSIYMNETVVSPPADRLLRDGDIIEAGRLRLEVIETPGHTPGGISLYSPGVLFSGDTLFAENVGRTDLPGGDSTALLESIRSRLMRLPDDTEVYPGHGEPTTIERERHFNPFV